MQSTLYISPPAPCHERYLDPSDLLNTSLQSTHDLFHFASHAHNFSPEMPSALLHDQPPDLPSPRTAARAYDELEGYQSSSPEKWIQSPSPCTMSPNPLILDNYTCPADDLLSDPYLSTFTTFQDIPDIPDCPFMAQKPETPETPGALDQQQGAGLQEIPICWDHGCNGKVFSSWSNLRRHQRERACKAPKCYCPRCGAHFSRTTARNQHLANMSCKRIRRYSNGRTRPGMQKIQETYGAQM